MMKTALVILNLFSEDPPTVIEFPTEKICMAAMQEKLLEKPPGVQALITCGPLFVRKADLPKGEKIE